MQLLRYWHQFHDGQFMDSWKREARPDAWEESVSAGCLSTSIMNARDTVKVIQKLYTCRSTAIIELLHEIIEIVQRWYKNFPALARVIV